MMPKLMGIDLTNGEYDAVQRVLRAYSIKDYDENKCQQAEKNAPPDLWRRLDIDYRFYNALRRNIWNLELEHLHKIVNGEMKIKNIGSVGIEQIKQALVNMGE